MSLHGEADLHALTAAGATVYGWNSLDGPVLRGDDSGRTWQRGATLSTAALTIDPADRGGCWPRRRTGWSRAATVASPSRA
ncbi:hypothetical protein ACVGVM_14105 [Pseudonocardia bannensis]|uniref:Uncharacterized protein n=1 Tax=Pseudonocardia bannensis TaxID=630973 RepID=A0A848DE47_9PSEU|nr:hypothetical protein [Pseudonocardia bannensis]NMH90862.1 hypothetical protein [Pseudonocardia bannensis]